jgi:hypothetical protein
MSNNTQSGSTQPHTQAAGSGVGFQDAAALARDVGAGGAVAKLTDVAQQTGQQAKDSVTALASEANKKAKGMLNEQISMGAGLVGDIAESIKLAADHLDEKAPQIAGLVRGAAERSKELSRDLQDKSVDEIFRTASDFTRRQPAVVFGTAALFGFFCFRLLKSAPVSEPVGSRTPGRRSHQMSSLHGTGNRYGT